jgi:hypothetical protein
MRKVPDIYGVQIKRGMEFILDVANTSVSAKVGDLVKPAEVSKASTDGLTRFIIKLAARRGGWLYLTQICKMDNYKVERFQYGPNRDRAQRMGKVQAEMVAENMRKSRRFRPEWVVVEPEVVG